jgi:hypothetical protein
VSEFSSDKRQLGEEPAGNYLLSSFLGLHFSQTLPSFLASTQHLCLHSLPAALAFSQQVSALARVKLLKRATAQAMAVNVFTLFPLFVVVGLN